MDSHLRIRPGSPGDAEELLAIYAPYVETTAITFEYEVPSPAEFAERIRRTEERYPYLAAEADGRLLGYAYAGAFKDRAAYSWSVETSVYVRRDQRRRGVGKQLYGALERALAAQGVLNLNACIAYPAREDPYLTRDSVAFHERLGFRTVGRFQTCGCKFRRWYDMVWMEKLIGSHRENPLPVKPFGQLDPAALRACGIS